MKRTFEDAVRQAKGLQEECPQIFGGAEPVRVVDFANWMQGEKHAQIDFLIDPLLPAKMAYFLKFKGQSRYRIVVSGKSNFCWKRFTLCKELCHVWINHPAAERAAEMMAQLEVALQITPGDYKQEISAEEYAFCLAAELMFPVDLREHLAQELKDGVSDFDVADQIKAPERLVHMYYKASWLAVVSDFIRRTPPLAVEDTGLYQ